MSPTTKANVAFGVGLLSAFYAVGGMLGGIADLLIISRGGVVPDGYWWIIGAVAIGSPLSILMFRYRRRMKRRAAAACESCGYDLRATPDRCPECGAALSPTIKASELNP